MTIIRGIAAGACAIAIAGAYQVSSPVSMPAMASAMPQSHLMCEEENAVGDCVRDTPSEQNGGDNCVLINELGACEDQQEVDDPAHTMLR